MNLLQKSQNVFIIGIKGVAMANLAVILKKMGIRVSGSDLNETFITDEILTKHAISWQVGFDQKSLPSDTDLVVYSAAHKGSDNPQVLEAIKKGKEVTSQAKLLGDLLDQFKTKIAICGSHGKTTTSSLVSYALIRLGKRPSYLIGAPRFNVYDGGDYQKTDYFVIEADEYGVNPPLDKTPKFHFLKPNYIIGTNIDFDHPDVYRNLDDVAEAFLSFFNGKNLTLCLDDPMINQSLRHLPQKSYQTYGFSEGADFVIKKEKTSLTCSSFELWNEQKYVNTFEVSLFGRKNISNAAGAVALLLNLGFSAAQIKKALSGFSGAKRRFEHIFSFGETHLFDDYAHHPKEIETTIRAARDRFRKRRVIVIFQPHTYSRTQSLLDEFAHSLSLADYSLLLPIFPSARENAQLFTVSSKDIAKRADPKKNVIAVDNAQELTQKLNTILRAGDIVFTMGAGDVYKLKDALHSIITHRT